MSIQSKNEDFGRFIDEKVAEYERMVEALDHPLKCEKMGEFLAPHIRLYLERECDQR